MSKIIAVNYRLQKEDKRQGCWKQFTDQGAANVWLNWRTGKGKDSPKGAKIYTDIDEMKRDLQDPKTPASLRLAIQAHLNWLSL